MNENEISLTPCFQNTALLGVPAIFAGIFFLSRSVYLRRNGIPHGIGRVFAYWPSQLALAGAVVALILAHTWTVVEYQSGLFAVVAQVVALVRGNEQRFSAEGVI